MFPLLPSSTHTFIFSLKMQYVCLEAAAKVRPSTFLNGSQKGTFISQNMIQSPIT